MESNLLEEKKNNYIVSVYKNGTSFGLASCDISTGEFSATQIVEDNNFEKLLDEISRFNPSELVINPFFEQSTEEISKVKKMLSNCLYISNK